MNKNSSKNLFLIIVSVLVIVLVGCDPSDAELTKGKNFDVSFVKGKITEIKVGTFAGDTGGDDYKFSNNHVGEDYYIVSVNYKDQNNRDATDVYQGVPKEVVDNLKIGMQLPIINYLTMTQLLHIRGDIIDMRSDLRTGDFWTVIQTPEQKEIWRTDIDIFYDKIKVGMELPIVEY